MIYVIDMGGSHKKIYLYQYKKPAWVWEEFMPIQDDMFHGSHLTKMFHLSDNDSKVMVF